eukprot:scaffold34758_cov214-Amphora_coffeaeformis.AAC.1
MDTQYAEMGPRLKKFDALLSSHHNIYTRILVVSQCRHESFASRTLLATSCTCNCRHSILAYGRQKDQPMLALIHGNFFCPT